MKARKKVRAKCKRVRKGKSEGGKLGEKVSGSFRERKREK